MPRLAVPRTDDIMVRRNESRLRELDRKSATATSNVEALISSARHHWSGSGSVNPGGVTVPLVTWAEEVNEGVATLAGGALVLTEAGRWSIWLQYQSDSTVNGTSLLVLAAESVGASPWRPATELRDERYRASGWHLAGNLTQSVSWSGVVTAEQAASPLRPRVIWRNASGSTGATGSWWMTAHYLGATRLPDA